VRFAAGGPRVATATRGSAMIGGCMDDELLTFDCPRCRRPAQERFWGPCRECRDALAATIAGEPRTVEVGAFEPTMHVVPNQVATKD
jgi:hypothetical protein